MKREDKKDENITLLSSISKGESEALIKNF